MLGLRKVTKYYKDKPVLDGVDIAVNPGEVVALIGANGSGKTTLLRLLLGEIEPDSGTLQNDGEILGYVSQDIEATDMKVVEYLDDFEPWRIEMSLREAGLDYLDGSELVDSLSGGERTRLAISSLLARDIPPTVLLLDEPTNNLDTQALDWLEEFVTRFRGGILIATHERSFINAVADRVVELTDSTACNYGGDYEHYREQKQMEEATKKQEYEEFLSEKRRLLRLRQSKSAHMQKASSESFDKVKHESRAGFNYFKNVTEANLGKQINAIDSRLKQLKEPEKPKIDKNYYIDLHGQVPNTKRILELEGVCKSFDSRMVLDEVSLEVYGAQRVWVQGKNGTGKTTLLKIAAGLLEPDSGAVKPGESIRLGYYSQKVDGLNHDESVLENLKQADISPTIIFREAVTLGLSEEDIGKKVGLLSRGQQAKVAFMRLLLSHNHLLILDEPTNHLDIPTREHIEHAMQRYQGAVLLASHDKYFARQIGISREFNL